MQSAEIDKLAAALAKAQGAFQPIKKDKTASIRSTNGASYSYSYADLASVIDAIRKPLADNGLAYVQPIIHGEGGMHLETRLLHASGQWIGSTYPLPSGGRAQEMGSAQTYARRYALCALVGIVAEDDDDGGNAGEAKPQPAKARDPSPPIPAATPPAAKNGNGKTAEYVLMAPNGKVADRFPRPGAFLEALDQQMADGDDPQAWWESNKVQAMKISADYPAASRALIEHMLQRVEDYGREIGA